MSFKCDSCTYSTQKKSNFNRHVIIHNKNKEFICECGSIFTKTKYYNKHIQTCKSNDVLINNKCKSVENENKELWKSKYIDAQHEIKFLKQIICGAGLMLKESISPYKFISQHYSNAPILEPITKNVILKKYKNEVEFAEDLLHHHRNKKLYIMLGNIIINEYVKPDPQMQSTWNSDASRFTYINRIYVENNNCYWSFDKKGEKVIKLLILPLLECIREILSIYTTSRKIPDNTKSMAYSKYLEQNTLILHIHQKINDNSLCNDVFRYMSSYFYLDVNLLNKQLK
jgi:hypothetical protein